MRRKKQHPVLKTLVWLAISLTILAVLAPVQLGGQVGYIIVSGNSMLPNYQYHDLVLTRQSNQYQLGDVIAYHDPILDGIVFHRIMAIEGNQYQTKGDNNSWFDVFRPSQEDIVGKAWVQLSGIGEYILVLNQPAPFAVIVSAFVLLLFVPSTSQEKHRKKRK